MNVTTEWIKYQKDNPKAFDASTLGPCPAANQYLFNRLHKAYMHGVAMGQEGESERVLELVKRALRG